MTDDGMLRATTRTGLSVTQVGVAQVPTHKSAASKIAAAVIGLAVLGGGAFAAFSMSKKEEPAPTAATPPATVTQIVTQVVSAEKPAVELKRYNLAVVAPDSAVIAIDGATQSVKDGNVEVAGALGNMKKVTIQVGDKVEEFAVAITGGGLVPSKVEAKAKEAAPVAAGPRGRPAPAAKPAAKPAEAKPAEAKPAKPKSNVETGMDEFK
jgi:predicted ribosomally synthesized peptide with SipW-like signal peptide